jgi:hypothetical protein
MGNTDKLIIKALNSPQNLRFEELCKLCEVFGMKLRKKGSSGHSVIYKYKGLPSYTLTIQDDKGKSKPYQVGQLLTWAKKMGFVEDF